MLIAGKQRSESEDGSSRFMHENNSKLDDKLVVEMKGAMIINRIGLEWCDY
jgi:hypothetical protein